MGLPSSRKAGMAGGGGQDAVSRN